MSSARHQQERRAPEQTTQTRARSSLLTLPAAPDEARQPCRLCPLCACGYPECRTVDLEAVSANE